jgi:DNA-binding CsgD family transcriptional regulator
MSGLAHDFLDSVAEAAATAPPSVSFRSNITPIMSGSKPSWDIQNEQGYHRIVCYRTAAGDTPKEIATALGVDPSTVYNILKQDRSKELVATIIHEAHSDDITAILRGAASQAVMIQVELMKFSKDENVRLRSATDILNRAYGTPCKASEMPSKKNDDPLAEMAELDRQIASLAGGPVHDAEEIPLNVPTEIE